MPEEKPEDDEVCKVAFQCAMDVLRDKCGGKCARKVAFVDRFPITVEYPEAEIQAIKDSSVFSPEEKLAYVKGLDFVQAQARQWACGFTKLFMYGKGFNEDEVKKAEDKGIAEATDAIARVLLE